MGVLVLIAASRDSGLTWTTGREFFGQVYRDAAAVDGSPDRQQSTLDEAYASSDVRNVFESEAAVNRRRRVAAATLRMVVGAWIVSTLLHGTIFELRTAAAAGLHAGGTGGVMTG